MDDNKESIVEETEENVTIEATPELINEPTILETHVEKKVRFGNILMILIVVLLTGLVILNLLQYFSQRSQQELAALRAETYSVRVDNALINHLNTQKLLDSLIDDYDESIYKDKNVTNINQQQFRAIEYNFLVLNYIARQNQEIILLLSSLP